MNDLISANNDSVPVQTAPPDCELEATGIEGNPYFGAASSVFSKEAIDILTAPPTDDEISIRPDGLLFPGQVNFRRRLTRAFGPGCWAIIPTEPLQRTGDTAYRTFRLYVNSKFISETCGEAKVVSTGGNNSLATLYESVKSDAITRAGKDLSMFDSLWDTKFCNKWKSEHAIQVFVKHNGTGKVSTRWRLKTDPKFGYPYHETGTVTSEQCETEGDVTGGANTGENSGVEARQFKKPTPKPQPKPKPDTNHESQYSGSTQTFVLPIITELGDASGRELISLTIGQLQQAINNMNDVIKSAEGDDAKERLKHIRNDIFKELQRKTANVKPPVEKNQSNLEEFPEPDEYESVPE